MAASLHSNGSISSTVALAIARQTAESSLTVGATTDQIPEGSTKFYFTNQRARNAISANTPLTYNNLTGLLGITIGSTSNSVCAGNDSRLSDARTPLAHTHSISNITNLQTTLDGKANVFTGYTGSITIVTGVDFNAKIVTTSTITISNGVITNVS